MATLKKELKEILEKYGIDPQDKNKLWDCHGTLVLYHKAYEIIAAKENIKFDPPTMLETNSKEKIVALLVTGYMGERVEWSFGEASPSNLKSTYPYAMAEKRAKDRVIAKLVGLAQYVYSEDEAEEFKNDKQPVQNTAFEPIPDEQGWDLWKLGEKIQRAQDDREVEDLLIDNAQFIEGLPVDYQSGLDQTVENKKAQLKNGITNPVPTLYRFHGVEQAIRWTMKSNKTIGDFKTLKALERWENEERSFINALDILKAEKYKKDGKSPKERLLDLLASKRSLLTDVNTLNTPIG